MSSASAAAPSLPSRPASAPLQRRPIAVVNACRPLKPVVDASVGGVARAPELDVSYGRDEVDVCREMVLVSLIEGAVRSSGVRAVLYKCHMCGGFVTSLGGLTRHMATHGSARPPTSDRQTDDIHRHRLNNAPTSPSGHTAAWATSPARCNGHTDSGDVGDADLADDTSGRPCDTVASSSVVDSSQQQAEDLSRSTTMRRQRPSVSGRRRAATTTEPVQCRRPSQRLAYVSSEMLASDESASVCGGELASEIRAKEHLDDDVTVVIPSDAPLDYVARTEAPPSDTPTWSQCSDDGNCTEEIAHAPVKSIMGHPHVQRKARLSGSSSTTTTSAVDNGPAVSSSIVKTEANVASAQQLSMLNVNPESLQFGGLPAMFGPLALSTFVHGFGGLVAAASPFLSYYTHMPTAASLASLMAVTSTPVSSPPPALNTAMDCSKLSEQQPEDTKSEDSPPTDGGADMQVEEVSSNGSGSSGWNSDPLSAGFTNPVTKCSSLSRTHSRSIDTFFNSCSGVTLV